MATETGLWIFLFLHHLLKGFQSLSCESYSNTGRVGILHCSTGSDDPSYDLEHEGRDFLEAVTCRHSTGASSDEL